MLHILEVKSAVYFSGVPQTTNLTWGRSKKDGVKKGVMRDGWGGELTRIDQSAGETAWAAEEVKPTHTHSNLKDCYPFLWQCSGYLGGK